MTQLKRGGGKYIYIYKMRRGGRYYPHQSRDSVSPVCGIFGQYSKIKFAQCTDQFTVCCTVQCPLQYKEQFKLFKNLQFSVHCIIKLNINIYRKVANTMLSIISSYTVEWPIQCKVYLCTIQ